MQDKGKGFRMTCRGQFKQVQMTLKQVPSLFSTVPASPPHPPPPQASLSPPGAPSLNSDGTSPRPPPFQWPPFSQPFPSGPRPPPVLSAGTYFPYLMRVAQARIVRRLPPPSSPPHPSTDDVKGRPSRTRIRYLPSVVGWREPAPMPSSFQRGPPSHHKCWFL
jgi:hypothetical protein